MKIRSLFLLAGWMLGVCVGAQAFSPDSLARKSYRDVKYAEPEACAFDLFLPEATSEVPLVVIIHGGGFQNGDKKELGGYDTIVTRMLDRQVAVASINYRFRKGNDGLGVKRCLSDAVDFIQYIRFHAPEYGIDKNRIAAIGESAGAGTSLFLAFHDEMADPDATEAVKKESTRLTCVGALSTQATYNLYRWPEFMPGVEAYLKQFANLLLEFYGFETPAEFEKVKEERVRELDMLAMISPDDCPVFVCNLAAPGLPQDLGHLLHHPAHAQVVADYAVRNGLKTVHYTSPDAQNALSDFLLEYLK